MLTGIRGIIFDLDGTMIDSMWLWREIDIEFMGARNLPFTEQLAVEIEGMSFAETAEYFIRTYSLAESAKELMEIWTQMAMHKYRYEIPLKPGLRPFLEEMRARGIRMGIATSNGRRLLDAAANAHGLYDYMDAVLTADEVQRGKPAPDVYLGVAKKLGLSPQECLVFEDVPQGIRAGLAAGMRVCAVADEYSAHLEAEKRALAHYFIESFAQVVK